MTFDEFKEKLKELNVNEKKFIEKFIDDINISKDNFDHWVKSIFSDKITELELNKLPYVIDSLFTTNDKLKFMLCCMLIESTCEFLPFITNLENYPIYKAKYDVLKNTLVTVYEKVDNGIANCMALIIINNDPTFELLEIEEKERLVNATNRKLKCIIDYLKNSKEIDSSVYQDLEIIIDLASHMNDNNINEQVEKLSFLDLDFYCYLFVVKYKLINKMIIQQEEIERLIKDKQKISKVFSIFEKNGGVELLRNAQIKQEEIAKSNMIEWLKYPTELGKEPEDIQLLGTLDLDNEIIYIYKFKSKIFEDKGYMVGISGGYEKNKITSITTGMTFSQFERLEKDYIKQGKGLVEFIRECWKKRASKLL